MDVPFESFADLVYRLSHPPKPICQATGLPAPLPPSTIFTSWLNHHRPFPPKLGKHLFRLLFPHEGSRRRYGLKESKLSRELEAVLGLRGLARWDSVSYEGCSGTGCLGKEVEQMMKDRLPQGHKSSLTIAELDQLLDQLASLSPFSQLSQPGPSALSQTTLLSRLFRDSGLSPYALAVLTQIILRDLRPLLSPLPRLPTRNPTAMLRLKSNAGPAQLELYQAMQCWGGQMVKLYYAGQGDLDWCVDAVEEMRTSLGTKRFLPGPRIPKCRKGRSIEDALKPFFQSAGGPSRSLWAETKYDGYRVQIHVQRAVDGSIDIKVFSKSKRDSTEDRLNAHSIMSEALDIPVQPGLPIHSSLISRATAAISPQRSMRQSVILEAEVVPYNEGTREGGRGPGIEEFWHLGDAGVTPLTGEARVEDRNRHLCLVFFDVLHLDGESLLDRSYDERRKVLENVIKLIPGFSILANRFRVPLWKGMIVAQNILEGVFRETTEAREEGLVLKAAESTYLDSRFPWVKLKKDYIPNLGDCIDLVVLGAGWDIDRARELRADTSVFTTFYVGVLTNREKVKSKRETPNFEILFRASYGMDRKQLEVYNENIRLGRWRTKPFDKDDPLKRRLLGLSWTYHLPRGMTRPSVMFDQPLCAELMGAGFQKLPLSEYYELRWPRLQKIFPPDERKWTDALGGPELIATARQALGYGPDASPATPISPHDDSVRAAWRSSSQVCLDVPDSSISPHRSPNKRRRMQSAPDVLKLSPPTPPPSSPVRPGWHTIATPNAGRRMQAALLDRHDTTEVDASLPMFPTPPRSSPARRNLLSSPLYPAVRDTMAAIGKTEAHPNPPARPPLQALQPTRAVIAIPTHSQVDSGQIRDLDKTLVDDSPNQKRKRPRPRLRPLSLRSRLKLAARKTVPV